ncbi:hypothetical protein B2J88_06640 [Rhodococcus sp. SRB_17]|uniref:hypothetical protein n=1 Tax=Rhodococcus sp. OK302 TaxID=1882769 RepID=UPI000B9404BE|nr:hypothetical protein [Rhodococcus sp. OK302]NMM84035.1 hypothetical protein [Rhodococcus sp. SRB_17]OYD68853.1 hypothetical protein BDB13_2412 [Rhodococcus sp. OK302]
MITIKLPTVDTTDPRRRLVVMAAITIISAAAVLAAVPVGLRTVAMTATILVPGWALYTLVFGGRADQVGRDSRGSESPGGPLHLLLPILLAMATLLGTALALGPLGLRFTAASITLTLTIFSLILLSLLAFREHRAPPRSRDPVPEQSWRRLGNRVFLALVATVLCVGALVGARALQPAQQQPYVNTILTEPDSVIAGQLDAAPEAPVNIKWISYSYGFILPAAPPTVTATVGGSAPTAALINMSTPTAPFETDTDARSAQVGILSFLAPSTPGRYRVAIDVTLALSPATAIVVDTADAFNPADVGPTSLVLYLAVTPR